MDRETAIRKVLACLRLSKSANPAESATAMRQALAMMAKFGLDDIDVAGAGVKTAEAKTRSRGAVPPQSIVALVCVIEEVFRCVAIVRRKGSDWRGAGGETKISFYGNGADPEVAAYAFCVLRRTLEIDKARHTKRVKKAATKLARGEAFALAWVHAVRSNFPQDSLNVDERKALKTAVDRQNPGIGAPQPGRDLTTKGRASPRDDEAGWQAGRKAQVNPGINEPNQRKLEHTP